MADVITGTRKAKAKRAKQDQPKVNYKKRQHRAGVGKMRCPRNGGCGIGMAVLVQAADGKWVYRCDRCQREFHADQRL